MKKTSFATILFLSFLFSNQISAMHPNKPLKIHYSSNLAIGAISNWFEKTRENETLKKYYKSYDEETLKRLHEKYSSLLAYKVVEKIKSEPWP